MHRKQSGALSVGAWRAWSYISAALLAVAGATAHAEYKLNFQTPATSIAREQYDLHVAILIIITLIGIGVFGVMIYSIIVHRKSAGYKAATFHENTAVELAWTIIPFIIVIIMVIPATRVILDAKDAGNPDLTVKVVGYQWKWSYDHLDDNVFYYSSFSTPVEQIGPLLYGERGTATAPRSENYLLEVDKPLVVPVGKKVRLLITAADVIHSWWVPQLGVKQDAIPGIVREAWFQIDKEGVYRGQCTELCGKNHAFMPIVVEAVSVADYATWVVEQGGGASTDNAPVGVGDVIAATPVAATGGAPTEWTAEAVMTYGENLYAINCAACHQANGEGLDPSFPALKGSAIATGPAAEHIAMVLNGVAGTAMVSYAFLSDAEIAAIIHYERNAWGNDVGDLVTPEDIAAAR